MSEYTPQVGDTVEVEEWSNHEHCTVVVNVADAGGDYIVRDQEGRYYKASHLVKVEPTPADQLVMIGADGSLYFESIDPLDDMRAWNAEPEVFSACPWRVARFTFAEWIDR